MDNMDKYIGRMLDNRYAINEVIGRGGMAVVYKARCHLLNRNVAIKILRDDMASDKEFREFFKKEALAVAMLSHPNIVSVYDVSRTPEIDYIVMELVEGVTLKQYMKTKGALSEIESVHFAIQICRALVHAHSKGIIHRDIKPQNILITMDGNVKVSDFGIAYLESMQSPGGGPTVGSLHYISPEQAKGEPVDARADVYSLGVVLYEMLTGRLPYDADTAEAVALMHIGSSPAPLRQINPDISEQLEAITLKAMNANIEERYQSAQELLDALEDYRKAYLNSMGGGEPAHTEDAAQPDLADIPPDVAPISRSGELSREAYARRNRRATKISLLSGVFLVLIFIVMVFCFLWKYMLSDVFSETERINVPNFVGGECDDIIYEPAYSEMYNFTVVYAPSSEYEEGMIIAQEPVEGKSIAVDGDGIDVTLTVSSGVQMVPIPDVVNTDYRSASTELKKAGFNAVVEYSNSDSVTKDYVIYCSPETGSLLPTGSDVYITVSTGPDAVVVKMPNLIGLSKDAAQERLDSANLTVGSMSYTENDLPVGTVFWQSIEPYTEVDEHTKVYLQISTGPAETEPPVDETVEDAEER